MFFKNHPFHPAIVHFPIGFLTFAHAIDVLHYLTAALPALPLLTTHLAPLFPQLLSAARIMHIIGLATAIPAVASGVAQAAAQASKPGNLYESDGKTFKRKFLVMATHAALNDLVIIVSAFSWYGRFKAHGLVAEAAPRGMDYITSALIIPTLFYTASLGGDLVYKHVTHPRPTSAVIVAAVAILLSHTGLEMADRFPPVNRMSSPSGFNTQPNQAIPTPVQSAASQSAPKPQQPSQSQSPFSMHAPVPPQQQHQQQQQKTFAFGQPTSHPRQDVHQQLGPNSRPPPPSFPFNTPHVQFASPPNPQFRPQAPQQAGIGGFNFSRPGGQGVNVSGDGQTLGVQGHGVPADGSASAAARGARGHKKKLSISTATAALKLVDNDDSSAVPSETSTPGGPTSATSATASAPSSATATTPATKGKKKKQQKFFCEGFEGCNLSFTRSEHLLRHVRQHSTTVHADEYIPPDSLAATGARYPRNKTERAKQGGGRARSSTTGSMPPPASPAQAPDAMAVEYPPDTQSQTSQETQSDVGRRRARPHSLFIPSDTAKQRRPLMYQGASEYAASSPLTTPTSTTFTNSALGQSPLTSPLFPAIPVPRTSSPSQSPASSTWHNRRLSQPQPSQSQQPLGVGNNFQIPPVPQRNNGPMLPPLRDLATTQQPPTPVEPEMVEPPTPSRKRSRREPEEDNRRRTWHPGTFSGFVPPPDEDVPTLPPVHTLFNSIPTPATTFSSPSHSNRNSFTFPQSPLQQMSLPSSEPTIEAPIPTPSTRRSSFNKNDNPMFLHERSHSSYANGSAMRKTPPSRLKLERHSWAPNHFSGLSTESFPGFNVQATAGGFLAPPDHHYDDGPTPTKAEAFPKTPKTAIPMNHLNNPTRLVFTGRQDRRSSSDESDNNEVVITPASSVDMEGAQKLSLKHVLGIETDAPTNERLMPFGSLSSAAFHASNLKAFNSPNFSRPRSIGAPPQSQQQQQPPRPQSELFNVDRSSSHGSLDVLAEAARIDTDIRRPSLDHRMDLS
ncbi:C2H2 finger domain transcription factor dvrA [Drechslerella dactyloides]|uniref:C2H2 finger domain transcription factor dvrA n=1 Tax=Drechslerella dactyloides TaxID=74499 RepID=A0AAD6NI15_DREDA|nr:C2H2 finger domain transcription factor dvrA [Drechslerella dactyloides]